MAGIVRQLQEIVYQRWSSHLHQAGRWNLFSQLLKILKMQ